MLDIKKRRKEGKSNYRKTRGKKEREKRKKKEKKKDRRRNTKIVRLTKSKDKWRGSPKCFISIDSSKEQKSPLLNNGGMNLLKMT